MTTVASTMTGANVTRSRAFEALYLIAAPLMAVWVLGISLIDQQGYVDPAFYTGYGQSFERMMQMSSLTYYSARFPIMFLNTTSQSLLPGIGGYEFVRALVFATSALPLYVLARRHYGVATAATSYAFLFLNPLFPRILCWDLTTFLAIPAGLGGICLWLLAPRAWSLYTFAAGFLFAVSLNSHVFTGTAIGIFLGIEFIFSWRRRGGGFAFVSTLACAAAGAIVCFGLGMAFYVATVGFISPLALWRITISSIAAGHDYADTHFVALVDYYANNYEIYVPVLTAAALLTLNLKRLSLDTLEARVTWFALAYLSAYCIAVFVLHMNVVQYFWYFGHLTIAVYLAIPVMVARLAQRIGPAAVGVFAATLATVALSVSLGFSTANHIADMAIGNPWVPMAIVTTGALALLLLRLSGKTSMVAGTVLLALTLQVPFLSLSHLAVYDRAANAAEVPLFDAIRAYHLMLNRYDRKEQRVRAWYPTQSAPLVTLSSSNLLFTLQDPWAGPGLPTFGETELARLNDPTTGYVLLFSTDESQVAQGMQALRDAGFGFDVVKRQYWARQPIAVAAVLVKVQR